MSIDFEKDITPEMYEAVVEAVLYAELPAQKLKALRLCPKTWTMNEVDKAVQYIIRSDKFKQVKEDYVRYQKGTLIEEDIDTLMLKYNRYLQEAQKEGKYDVVVRILKEIRELKAIESSEMRFEVTFNVIKPTE